MTITLEGAGTNGRVRKYSNAGYSSMGRALSYSVTRSRFHARQADKGTTTRAKGEPEVVGRGSGSNPVEEHC